MKVAFKLFASLIPSNVVADLVIGPFAEFNYLRKLSSLVGPSGGGHVEASSFVHFGNCFCARDCRRWIICRSPHHSVQTPYLEDEHENGRRGAGAGGVHLSVYAGGTADHNIGLQSSSGFFQGSSTATIGSLAGASSFADVYKFGWATLSVGAVYDYMAASETWHGGCGGFPCSGGSTSLDQSNLIGEAKLTFPFTTGTSLNIYAGGGEAWIMPRGTPTGLGGPAFEGSRQAAAFRVGWGMDQQFNQNWSAVFKVGFQQTQGTTFSTTTTERFELGARDQWIGAIVLTYTPPSMSLNAQ